MTYWETAHERPEASAVARDFAEIWQAAEKVVYSKTLQEVATARTRLERDLDIDQLRRLKEPFPMAPVSASS